MTASPIDDLALVLTATGELVAGVQRDQWDAATPCTDWNVRELVSHMVIGHRLFNGILRGEVALAPGALDPTNSDVLGNDPAAAYRSAAEGLLAAFRRPGVLDQRFRVPAGDVPGIAAVHLRAVEELVHGWDLARATNQKPRYADEVVERQLDFTKSALPEIPPDRSPFAPPREVPETAPPLEKLAALLGRDPKS
ncbi:TIGR03086 family metal-binding protein [Saccharopolyspora sp. WRP15-2]|uniref:TIGR03086 family metal-binding protein n=1 Tax=Saccharopolyspora oryzae TaxID=2997343 RepID=A0ABT4V0J1_9PSEU|nr:TIGR03086 family metal-binding protein [Saccharopolyspora oryzae]MDA3626919.1 TIGR03086 family metal-binding protein [Saccharopolyspora oryzae]